MGAQYKPYAYGDNAQVLKNRVNNESSPSDKKEFFDEEMKSRLFGPKPDKNNKGVFSQSAVDLGNNIVDAVKDASTHQSPASQLDIAWKSNRPHSPGVASPAFPDRLAASSGKQTSGPAQFALSQEKAGTSRFDPSKLTMGNNPFTGKVAMFKDGQALDNQDAAGLLGQKGGGSMMRMNTDNMTGTINYTDTFNQDAKIGQMRLKNAKNDYRTGSGNPAFFTGPGEPGPGTYGPEAMQFRQRREMLQGQVDDFNRKNPITSGMSVGDIVSNTMATSQLRGEIKQIDEQIFGRTQLANRIMEALIGKQTALETQGVKNKGDWATQALENSGMKDIYAMREGAETQRNRENIEAGRFDGKRGVSSEKSKARNDFLKNIGQKRIEAMIANGSSDEDIMNFTNNFANTHFGEDDDFLGQKGF